MEKAFAAEQRVAGTQSGFRPKEKYPFALSVAVCNADGGGFCVFCLAIIGNGPDGELGDRCRQFEYALQRVVGSIGRGVMWH